MGSQAFRCEASNYDLLLVGSDQVWNCRLTGVFEDAMFLRVPSLAPARKASYAASFGNSIQPDDFLSKAAPYLKQLGSISVRDELSHRIVRDLTGRDADVVVDPTLLLDRICDLRQRAVPEKFALAYFVDVFHPEAQASVNVVRKLTGLPVVALSVYRDLVNADQIIADASIEEWLYLFHKAELVIGDSYHGTLFSIKERNPFFSLCADGFKSARIADFLAGVGAEGCAYASAIELERKLKNASLPDYPKIKQELERQRSVSIDYLRKVLKGAS